MVYAGQVLNCFEHPMEAYDRILTMCGYRTDYGKYVLNFGAYGIITLAILEFIGLGNHPVPYGRYASRKFGPLIPAKLAWFAAQLPSVLIPAWVFLTTKHSTSYIANYILLGMFVFHYMVKTFIHPLIIRGEHPMPLLPFLLATTYCAINGYLQSKFLLSYADYGYTWVLGLRFIVGGILFLTGMAINLHSDATLALLRPLPGRTVAEKVASSVSPAADAAGPGAHVVREETDVRGIGVAEKQLAIPHGGMFEHVSSANYFGEILEWLGFAIAGWSVPALAHFLFTCGNLIPRGVQHHRDYLAKFKENYPRNRRAVIPGIL